MTKEEFYYLAENKPEIIAKSIYSLTIRQYRNDIKEYEKTPDKQEWSFPIFKMERIFSSKEEAEKAMGNYLKLEKSHIHSFLIERITIDTNVEDTRHLEWYSYDAAGNLIMKSLCTSTIPEFDKLTIDDIFLGRQTSDCPFKMGEIVEIVHKDKVSLEILNGLSATIEDCWGRYEQRVRRWGPKVEGPFYHSDFFTDCMSDQMFYISESGFDPDVPPDVVVKPTFPIPAEAKEILTARYKHWKSYIDSHSREKINWEELEKIVRGEK